MVQLTPLRVSGTASRTRLHGCLRAISLCVAGIAAGCETVPTPPSPPHVDSVIVGGAVVADGGEDVRIIRAGATLAAQPGMGIEPGDQIVTGPRAQAVLALEDEKVRVVMLEDTSVRVSSIFVDIGEVIVRILGRLEDAFEVESEYATAGAEGTEFLVGVRRDGGYRCVSLEGGVNVRSPRGTWQPAQLRTGEEAAGAPGTPIAERALGRDEYNALVKRVNEVELVLGGSARLMVPNLVGLAEGDARQRLAGQGLTSGTADARVTGSARVGTVVGQAPAAGTRLGSGRAVTLQVEAEATSVPDVTGRPLGDARQLLARSGLRVGRSNDQLVESGVDGAVLSQSIPPGTRVARDTAVDVTVAASGVRVPSLVGSPESSASAVLQRSGLLLGSVSRQAGPGKPGTVIDQKPSSGTLVRRQSSVSIVVAQAQAQSCVVPEVRKMSSAQAQKVIAGAGLRSQIASTRSRADLVQTQSPGAGASVTCGSTVTLTLVQ
jgi:beta-lactam-binding protein with PASTA domain